MYGKEMGKMSRDDVQATSIFWHQEHGWLLTLDAASAVNGDCYHNVISNPYLLELEVMPFGDLVSMEVNFQPEL